VEQVEQFITVTTGRNFQVECRRYLFLTCRFPKSIVSDSDFDDCSEWVLVQFLQFRRDDLLVASRNSPKRLRGDLVLSAAHSVFDFQNFD
jgi:hypothetical protein